MKWINPFTLGEKLKAATVESASIRIAARMELQQAIAKERATCAQEDIAEMQARTLDAMNARNHYSESLTLSFRKGRPA